MKIAIVLNKYFLGVSASIIEIVKTFAEQGWQVDIFIRNYYYNAAPLTFTRSNINLFIADEPKNTTVNDKITKQKILKLNLLLKALRHWIFRGDIKCCLQDYMDLYESEYCSILSIMEEPFKSRTYAAVIGIEASGLVAASTAVKRWQVDTPVIYYNLELMQQHINMRPNEHILKYFEILCSRTCLFTMIPDDKRGSVFEKANGIRKDKLRYLPVTTEGEPLIEKSSYLNDMFGMAKDSIIVL
jgi:hypothetical protein